MKRTIKIITVCFAYLFSLLGCNLSSKTAAKFISELNNIQEVKIYLNQNELILHLTDIEDIEYFLSTFKSTQRTNLQISSHSDFQSDGYIQFTKENEDEYIVKIDADVGYFINISNKDYYEKFTYLTGRYLAEIR